MLLLVNFACLPSPLPRQDCWNSFARTVPSAAAIPITRRAGSCVNRFEACSAFTARYGPHARQVTYVTLYTRGSDGFVSSAAAPIASGWSEPSSRAGLTPAVNQCLFTAHVHWRFGTRPDASPRIRHIYAEATSNAKHWASRDATSSGTRINNTLSHDACNSRALSSVFPALAASV